MVYFSALECLVAYIAALISCFFLFPNPCRENEQLMVSSIHGEVNRLARETGSEPNFKAVFNNMDDDGSGELSIDEFVESLARLG